MLNVSQCSDLDSGHTFDWVCVHSLPVTPCLLKEGGEERGTLCAGGRALMRGGKVRGSME